ncbi:MAG: amidohydrolase [Clostridiales bacterium]|nr:amidohydrolase [Clostridiales bacterium]
MNTLFKNVTVVTMNDNREVLKNAYVATRGDKIAAVSTEKPEGTFDRVIDGAGKVLMPGLVNAHTHVPMTLLRGYGGGHDLQTWLNDYIFPAEARLDSRTIHAGTALGMAELIAAGVTCIEDMYYFCDDMIEEVLAAGLNANISRGITCFQSLDDPAAYPPCGELRATAERYNGYNNGQIKVDVSIHGEYTSFLAPDLWTYLGRYAADNGLGMHVHISETKSEHEECLARHGKTPLQILDDYGVWDCGRSVAAHCVWVSDEDMDLMAKKHITAVHNPVSNLKLGSGVARVPELLRRGVNVALGTDGPSSNNNQDMFEEIKLASILACGVNRDAQAITPLQALEMATVNGAKALGRCTGSVQPGYDADLILVDFTRPSLTPCHDVVENLVYAARGGDVCLTMARGKVLYENGVFFTLDLDKIKSEVEGYALPTMFG